MARRSRNTNPLHASMLDYLDGLATEGRHGSIPSYELALRVFRGWCDAVSIVPPQATAEDLRRYQRWLAEEYRTESGQPLKQSTQATRLIPVLAYYRWLESSGRILTNPAASLRLPPMRHTESPRDYLDLQEATALLQSQAAYALTFPAGSYRRAEEERNLAMVSLAIATGRRRQSLLDLRVEQLDFERRELRIAWEKSMAGRVLPVAGWAVDVCRIFVNGARNRLLEGRVDDGYLFPGSMNGKVAAPSFYGVIRRMQARAVADNPDLEAFGAKHLTPHGLRVSFATLLFKGGCNIRSINELMLHRSLSTTARYTPIPLEDLQRVCRRTHPRA